MKIKMCPNCRIDLKVTKETRLEKYYVCSECGFERIVPKEMKDVKKNTKL